MTTEENTVSNFNGEQITAAMAIVKSVSNQEIGMAAASAILQNLFGLEKAKADAMLVADDAGPLRIAQKIMAEISKIPEATLPPQEFTAVKKAVYAALGVTYSRTYANLEAGTTGSVED
jgi:signal recognition particle GTPase